MWNFLAPLAGSAISGLFGMEGGRQNRQAQEQANLMNSLLTQRAQDIGDRQFQQSMGLARETNAQNLGINQSNEALQREFAQQGVRWRVADARAAGVHPSVALGGGGAAFSPAAHIGASVTPSGGGPGGGSIQAATGMGDALSGMGQDISRALAASASSVERNDAYTAGLQVANLENAKLKNELLRSQISRLRQAGGAQTALPLNQRYMVDGQGESATGALVKEKALERVSGDPSGRHREPGAITDVGHARTAGGSYYPVPSENVKERIEDNFYHETMHFIRNNIAPFFSERWFKPPFPARQGHRWGYNPFVGYEQYPTRFHERFTGRR